MENFEKRFDLGEVMVGTSMVKDPESFHGMFILLTAKVAFCKRCVLDCGEFSGSAPMGNIGPLLDGNILTAFSKSFFFDCGEYSTVAMDSQSLVCSDNVRKSEDKVRKSVDNVRKSVDLQFMESIDCIDMFMVRKPDPNVMESHDCKDMECKPDSKVRTLSPIKDSDPMLRLLEGPDSLLRLLEGPNSLLRLLEGAGNSC